VSRKKQLNRYALYSKQRKPTGRNIGTTRKRNNANEKTGVFNANTFTLLENVRGNDVTQRRLRKHSCAESTNLKHPRYDAGLMSAHASQCVVSHDAESIQQRKSDWH